MDMDEIQNGNLMAGRTRFGAASSLAILIAAIAAAGAAGIWLWQGSPEIPVGSAEAGPIPEPLALDVEGPIRALLAAPPTDPRRRALGERLFHDPGLSRDGTVACASCHDIAAGGDDGRAFAYGVEDRVGRVNAPSVLNVAFNFRQNWDGRRASLREQIDGPLLGEREMQGDWERILPYLAADPAYAAGFAAAYREGLTVATVKDALVQYELSLVRQTPFDLWLLGEADAIPPDAVEGYRVFRSLGCASCHQGVGVGGNMYHRMSLVGDYFADRGKAREVDYGRFNITGREEDRYVFKVPSLRNVALTAPYFHDGSVPTLEEAVRIMARYQLGRPTDELETRLIVAFLESLTAPQTRPPAAVLEPDS
jgi:cytochrome c peroxidase